MSVSIDAKKEVAKISCNVCSKTSFTMKGAQSKGEAYAEAAKQGWRCKSADMLVCPSCREKAIKLDGSKTVKTLAGKRVKSKLGSKTAKSASRPSLVNAGQSIGKLAKSAKMSSAPAAE